MKKLIVALLFSVPAFVFAQEVPDQQVNQNTNNPFKSITANQVDQDYIDISQMTAVLNISNTTRGAVSASRALINIPKEFVEVSQLTEGLERDDQDKIKALLNK